MMTANVFNRVFYFQYKNSTGTCFALDINGRQYVVTAKHVVDGIKNNDEIALFYNNNWHIGAVVVIGLGVSEDVSDDVAVLSVKLRISPSMPLEADATGLVVGQDVFFLGFPYGLYTDIAVIRGFPIALVKKQLCRAF